MESNSRRRTLQSSDADGPKWRRLAAADDSDASISGSTSMSSSKGTLTARAIADDVFGRETTREIWSGNYSKVLPLSVQDVELRAVLPAVFYMFRFGYRRGKGKFLETFGDAGGGVRE